MADDVSRGIAIHDLNKRWLQVQNSYDCPRKIGHKTSDPEDKEVSIEARKLVCALETQESPIDPKKYSTWRKLIRVTVYVLKFVRRIRNKTQKIEATGEDSPDGLSPCELYEAQIHWIKDTQKDLHSHIKKRKLTTLSPFTGSEGVIRVGGRADKATVSYESKHPMLLPTTVGYPSLLLAKHTVLVTMESQLQPKKFNETIGLYEDMILQSQ